MFPYDASSAPDGFPSVTDPSQEAPGCAIVLVSATSKSNGLGRAISMATALRALAPTRILAHSDGPLWRGAATSGIPVEPFRHIHDLQRSLSHWATERQLVVWSVKPLPWSYWPVRRYLATRQRPFLHLLDIDDLDAALSRHFRRETLHNRLIIHPAHPLHPRRIDRVVADALLRVTAVTGSSNALLEHLSFGAGRLSTVLPHVTPDALAAAVEQTPPTPRTGKVRLGFIGTARKHKGLTALLDLVRAKPDLELHVLRDELTPELSEARPRVVAHASAAEAYANTDVVALPQDSILLGARYQLPAKLLDALHFGKPVLMTPTPVSLEHVPDAVEFVSDWQDHGSVLSSLDRICAQLPELAIRNREIYDRRFSPTALRPRLIAFMSTLLSGSPDLESHGSQRAIKARGDASL